MLKVRFLAAAAIGPLSLHRQVMNLLQLWRARLRNRRELRRLCQLDDRLLRDMGLTRDDVSYRALFSRGARAT